jgi:hypothetical protein
LNNRVSVQNKWKGGNGWFASFSAFVLATKV